MRAAAAAGTPVALVIASGRPRLLGGMEALPQVGAVLQAFLPGPYGGTALAEALLGLRSPSGRLTVSWPGTATHRYTPLHTLLHTVAHRYIPLQMDGT